MWGFAPCFRPQIQLNFKKPTLAKSPLVCDRVALRAEILVIDPVADKRRLYGINGHWAQTSRNITSIGYGADFSYLRDIGVYLRQRLGQMRPGRAKMVGDRPRRRYTSPLHGDLVASLDADGRKKVGPQSGVGVPLRADLRDDGVRI